MRSVYSEETGYRTYNAGVPGLGGTGFWGREIESDTEFDKVQITCMPDGFVIGVAFLYNGSTQASQVPGRVIHGAVAALTRIRYERDDPEVSIVRDRIRSGDCAVEFKSLESWGGFNPPPVIVGQAELHEANWLLDLLHPFHDDDKDLFFEHLTRHLEYAEPAAGQLARFTFPGIIEGAERTYYRRDDTPDAPDVRAVADLAAAGWSQDIPLGPHRLHSVTALETPAGVSVSATRREFWRRADQTASIVQIARAWHKFWRLLPANERALNSRVVARKHFEHAIGRAWDERPHDGAIRVFHQGQAGSRERSAREAEDWMLGNLEQWVEWGFPEFVTQMGDGTKRAILSSELDDYTFCHVNRDGTLGDRLNNGADGITEATWNNYQNLDYAQAVIHGIDGLAVEALTIVVHQGDTETAQLVVNGGLAPHVYELALPPTWASIDAATGEITVSPDATVAAQDHTLRVKVTDDLGTVENEDVTVTVLAQPSE